MSETPEEGVEGRDVRRWVEEEEKTLRGRRGATRRARGDNVKDVPTFESSISTSAARDDRQGSRTDSTTWIGRR